jgi:hypothetical protein
MRRSVPIATALFLAACGGGGSDDTVVSSDPAPAPAELMPKTTRMACTDREGKTPTWWAEVIIDPAEYPWRSMSVTSQYGPYFVSDPHGDIVNARGSAAKPPPGSDSASQPIDLAQAYWVSDDVILVMIASASQPHLDLFKFRTDGTMIELGQSAAASRPGTICTPAAPGQ